MKQYDLANEAIVSVLVRTCGRTDRLIHNLDSIRAQTYPYIEIIVVEDGEPVSQKMCEEYKGPTLRYYATNHVVGRANAGNLAMSMARGSYFVFLDDDDLFYPDHICALVEQLKKTTCLAAYDVAEECICSYQPAKHTYKEYRTMVRFRQPFNRLYLTIQNYFPIQTVLFSRVLWEKYGGFREDMTYLEDWELWVRYASHTDFAFLDKIGSLYRVPLHGMRRDRELYIARVKAQKYFEEYTYMWNLGECSRELGEILEEKKMPKWKKYLKKLRNRILYGIKQ